MGGKDGANDAEGRGGRVRQNDAGWNAVADVTAAGTKVAVCVMGMPPLYLRPSEKGVVPTCPVERGLLLGVGWRAATQHQTQGQCLSVGGAGHLGLARRAPVMASCPAFLSRTQRLPHLQLWTGGLPGGPGWASQGLPTLQ